MSLGDLQENWDVIVIGGGITGAGIFREAVRMGLDVLLLERRDFAWGTSSRSAKLVHGGLRYLKEGRFLLTRESVHARERLLKEAPGLVDPLGFLMPVYEGFGPGRLALEVGLSIYDLMAHRMQHRFHHADDFIQMAPHIKKESLKGGFRFFDAQVDDARLVLRLIMDGIDAGGTALNYVGVTQIERYTRGEVAGLQVEDTETHEARFLSTRAVANATGAWAEELHPSPEPKRHLRPLRGSHLMFPSSVLPLDQAVSFLHPKDKRPIYAFPWEGAVLFGTTDVDHREDLAEEPVITQDEASYLLEGLNTFFPSLDIRLENCVSTFAGIRPVLSEGKLPPSKESREHVVWVKQGLVTVTGGKLTTFRNLGWDTLKALREFVKPVTRSGRAEPSFDPPQDRPQEFAALPVPTWKRLYGRYGNRAHELLKTASPADLEPIPNTHTLWAELPFLAKQEQIRHLSDLLLRRVRIGLLTPEGGKEHLERIRQMCSDSLPWDGPRWEKEIADYASTWKLAHSVPGKSRRG